MSAIIFDFDGTLADSFPIAKELYFQWFNRHLTDEEVDKLRNLPSLEAIKALRVPIYKLPGLVIRGRREFTKRMPEIQLFSGLKEVLHELSAGGHQLYLLSSNSSQNVRLFLKGHDIDQLFTDVLANIGLLGKSTAFRTIIRKHRLNKQDCISIADETRDVDAAKKVGITSLAVTWGYNGEKILRTAQPTAIIHQPSEIPAFIANRNNVEQINSTTS